MKEVELLSPAKNYETAIAAINSGADAIYIGASDFGARKNAPNTLEDIEKLVKYAHKFYVKVHILDIVFYTNTHSSPHKKLWTSACRNAHNFKTHTYSITASSAVYASREPAFTWIQA